MTRTANVSNSVPSATDWWSVATVVLGIGAFAFAQGLTYPVISLLLEEAGASTLMVGFNAAAFMVGLALGVVTLPTLSRWMRASHIVVAAMLVASLVLTAFAASGSPDDPATLAAWFALRLLLGYAVNAIYTLGEAWLNIATADSVRGRVSGAYATAAALGFTLGPLTIPLLGTRDGIAFAAGAATVAAVAVAVAVLARRARVEPPRITLADLPAFVRGAPILILLVLLYGFADATMLAMGGLHIVAGGGDAALAGLFIGLVHGGMVFAQLPIGWMLDRFDRWYVSAGCAFTSAAAFAAVAFLPATNPAMWGVAMIGGAGFFGLYTCALAILGREFKGTTLVSGTAAFSLVYAAGGAVGPPLAGQAMALNGALTFAPVAIFAVAVGIAAVSRRSRT